MFVSEVEVGPWRFGPARASVGSALRLARRVSPLDPRESGEGRRVFEGELSMSVTLRLFAALLALLVVPTFVLSAQKPQTPKKEVKPGPFALAKVGGEYRILPSAELKALEKSLKSAHKKAVEDWQTKKKEAAKAKRPFKAEKPKPTELKVIGAAYPTEAAAKEVQKKLEEQEAKKKKKP